MTVYGTVIKSPDHEQTNRKRAFCNVSEPTALKTRSFGIEEQDLLWFSHTQLIAHHKDLSRKRWISRSSFSWPLSEPAMQVSRGIWTNDLHRLADTPARLAALQSALQFAVPSQWFPLGHHHHQAHPECQDHWVLQDHQDLMDHQDHQGLQDHQDFQDHQDHQELQLDPQAHQEAQDQTDPQACVDHQDHQGHQDPMDPQDPTAHQLHHHHHRHHHHAQRSASLNASQHAHPHAAHRRSTKHLMPSTQVCRFAICMEMDCQHQQFFSNMKRLHGINGLIVGIKVHKKMTIFIIFNRVGLLTIGSVSMM